MNEQLLTTWMKVGHWMCTEETATRKNEIVLFV